MQQLKFIYKIKKSAFSKTSFLTLYTQNPIFFQAYKQICLYIAFEMRCTLPCTS